MSLAVDNQDENGSPVKKKKKNKGFKGKSVLAKRETARLFRLVYMKALLLFIKQSSLKFSTDKPSYAKNNFHESTIFRY